MPHKRLDHADWNSQFDHVSNERVSQIVKAKALRGALDVSQISLTGFYLARCRWGLQRRQVGQCTAFVSECQAVSQYAWCCAGS
jgi:hypothetical protein